MIGRLDRRRRAGAMTIAALLALAFLVATAPHQAASHPSAALGLQSGPAPWAPESALLGRRLAALRLPGHSDTVFHIHALLGQFFTIWGVRFTDTRIGGYTDEGPRRLRVDVDGRPVADPVAHILQAHDRIVVGYGPPGSFPTVDRTPFPPGL